MTGESAVDMSKPDPARVHNVLLGGADNYAADREQAGELTRIWPGLRDVVREDREFLVRAVTWAARPWFPGSCGPRRPGYGSSTTLTSQEHSELISR
jgi:hypothetical protein